MSLLLLILGVLVVAAGGGMVVFGIPINEFGLGNTLIVAGVTALTGGLILIGLSAAVSQLKRIADALMPRAPRAIRGGEPAEPQIPVPSGSRPAPRAPMPPRRPLPSEGQGQDHRGGEPRLAAPPVTVSAEAIDRLRAAFPRLSAGSEAAVPAEDETPLSPRAPAPAPKIPAPAPRQEPAEVAAAPRMEAAPVAEAPEPQATPRLNFPWRSKARTEPAPSSRAEPPPSARAEPAPVIRTEPAPAPPRSESVSSAPLSRENFDKLWPPSNRPAPTADAPAIQPNGDKPHAPKPESAPAAANASAQPVAILKSGVVDGMAYTLYADGSIEAKLPEGTVRFGSISELRTHLETHENQG